MPVEILETYPFCFIGDLDKYTPFLRRNCTAGVFNCSVSPNGDVRPCAHAGMTYGNLFKKSLRECWLAMSDWRNGTFLNEVCKNCPYLLQCSGGCRMDAKIYFGDIRGRDPLMTSPLRVKPAEIVAPEMVIPEMISFQKNVTIREEEFSGVIKYNDEIVFMNHLGYKTVKNLINRRISFKWRELNVPLPIEDVKKFFFTLFRKEMVV